MTQLQALWSLFFLARGKLMTGEAAVVAGLPALLVPGKELHLRMGGRPSSEGRKLRWRPSSRAWQMPRWRPRWCRPPTASRPFVSALSDVLWMLPGRMLRRTPTDELGTRRGVAC